MAPKTGLERKMDATCGIKMAMQAPNLVRDAARFPNLLACDVLTCGVKGGNVVSAMHDQRLAEQVGCVAARAAAGFPEHS